MERYSNKRLLFRRGGKFAKAPSLEQMGLPVNDREQTCKNCNHVWFPVLLTGICPNCDTPLQQEEK